MSGISSQALNFGTPENKYGYNGNQLQNYEFRDGSGLETYDFNARMYDPQLGRFFQIDPMSEYMRRWSPYTFSFDNPILYSDPTGKAPGDTNQLPDVVVTTSPKHRSNNAALGALVLFAAGKNATTWEFASIDPEPFTKTLLTLFAIASTAYAIHEIQQEMQLYGQQNETEDAVNKPPSAEEEVSERSEENANKETTKATTEETPKNSVKKESEDANRTAQDIISKDRKGGINKEFPDQYRNKTLKDIQKEAKKGNKEARKALKLLTDGRFKK
jgi:RHS repeat-associated protein